MIRKRTRALAASLRAAWPNARWALRIAWATSPSLLGGVAGLVVVRGMVPAGMALTARGLVNAAVAAFENGNGDIAPLVPWLAVGFFLTLTEGITGFLNKLAVQRLRDDLNFALTSDILNHTARLEVSRFEDPRFQDVLQRARDNPAEHVSRFIGDTLNTASSTVQVGSLLAILVYIEPLILIVAVLLAAPYLRYQWRLAVRQYDIERSRTTKRRWSGYFVSTVTGRASVGEVRLLRLAPLLIERFRNLMREFRDQDRDLYLQSFRGGAVFVLLTTTAVYAIFVRVAWRVLAGGLTLGDLAVFGGATTRLRNTLETLVLSVSGALERTLYIANVVELLETPVAAATPRPLTFPTGAGEILFENVSFRYPGTSDNVVDDVSLAIAAGETVAFVGENGAGKTTLLKLVARLYEPTAGRILVDGVDVRDLAQEDLQSRIAFVFQSFGRYEASAADNIAYGDWERLLGHPEEIEKVARLAGVHEMIEKLPAGYETLLGRGFGEYDLSGGQWQKIAVARAFARDAAILVLDEPTSNLDARAEYELFDRFRDLAHGRTAILVSHRFSTVSMAGRIVVMDRGRILESGTHEELMARAGSYATLYKLHQRRFSVAGR